MMFTTWTERDSRCLKEKSTLQKMMSFGVTWKPYCDPPSDHLVGQRPTSLTMLLEPNRFLHSRVPTNHPRPAKQDFENVISFKAQSARCVVLMCKSEVEQLSSLSPRGLRSNHQTPTSCM